MISAIKNKNSVFSVTILVIIAKTIAFLKEFVLSYYFGVSAISDAYNIAYTIPVTVIGFVAIALNTSYIPLYAKAERQGGSKDANDFSNNVISIVFWLSFVTFLFIEVFAYQVVKIFASGFENETLSLTIKLTRYMAGAVFLIGFNNILAAFVQLKNKYYLVVIYNSFLYIFSIIGIVAGYYWKLELLSIGVLIGYGLETICLIISSYRLHYKFSPPLVHRNSYLNELFVLVLPVLVGSLANEINKIVDKTISSNFATGGVSALSYSHKIDDAILAIFVTSMVSIAYPKLCKFVSEGKLEKLNTQIIKDLIFIATLIFPILLGTIGFHREIVCMLFVRGAFTENDSVIVSIALLIYSIGMLPTAIRKYYVRLYYAFGDSKTPASNSLIVIAINIVLSLILSRIWGLYGVALGSSISISIGAVRLVIGIRKHVVINYRNAFFLGLKVLLASLIMLVLGKVLQYVLSPFLEQNIITLLCIIFCIMVYFMLLLLLGMRDIFSHFKK